MIDLHLHTSASDGAHEPEELVRRAWLAGVRVMSVTDHDTIGAVPRAAAAARTFGIELVPGIEITAVVDGGDVHVLGYFIDVDSAALGAFLETQRVDRVRRARALAERLASLGMPIDVEPLLAAARDAGRVVGRPQVAAALVRAGHVATVREAFDRWIGEGRPAHVSRTGVPPDAVVGLVHEAGGVASLAHPGQLDRDDAIPPLARAGLDAIEAYHPDHDEAATARYRAMAVALGLAVTGGSDFHSDLGHHAPALGTISLPADDFDRLRRRAGRR